MAYEPNKYLDYFVIDEGYYPEINESSIKDPKNKWQSTFPHKDIVGLLRLTERTLSRLKKKSIWLEGSYGTGKSRIIWMMQNLLSCSEEDFNAYFERYDNLRNENDLRESLSTARKGKIVTATRYTTGDITSTQKLIFAVFESLTAALKKGGYKFDGAKTLRGKIAGWLESDAANLEMFRAKIQKPEYRMSATLANRSAEEIIARLKNPQAEVSQLVEEILKLGEREGIRAFGIDMEGLTDWIGEVIEENDLKAIILFWDEFSRFFANNRNNLDGLQSLAHLSNTVPFYLFIATHQSESLAGEGDQGFRSVTDRFNHIEITMPDNIALELIGHALQVKPVAKDEWDRISNALKERTDKPRKVVMDFAKISDEKILTDILPIHPMTAILLKNLAAYFASNQRSIFNFIKNSDPNIEAFQDFIAKKSPENGDLLTIDCLWNFFYESGTDEHGGAVGRMNLKPSIRAILDSYALTKDSLNLDEQVVLKTVLLFQAIDQESRGDVVIFRPTAENLELAFTGVDRMENGRVVSVANDLVRKSILFKKPGKVETFATMSLSGDFAEIEWQKKSLRETVRTAELVEKAKLIEIINLTPAQKARYNLIAVTADNFTATINRITNELETYKINVIICFARNEEEQSKIYNLVNEKIPDRRYHGLVFIDASSNVISRDVFDRWIENAANEKYWRGKDNALADKMDSNAADCLKEWRNSFETGSFVYYPAMKDETVRRKGVSCQNADQLIDELRDNVRRLYPYSFDDANITDTLFQSTNLKKLAEMGIKQGYYFMLDAKSVKVVLGDVWQTSGKYWEAYPELSISRLKVELDAFIGSEIEKHVRVSFDSIFEFLIERGFMPLNVYGALTGFLLKEYGGEPYRFSAGLDGNLGGAMTPQKLAEYVGESISQVLTPKKNYRSKYLEIMSPNQRQFMRFASEVFGVTADVSVEQSAQKLRLKLIDLGYPFWCYVEAAEERYKKILGCLADISNSKQNDSIAALAERAGQFLSDNQSAFRDLKNYLTAQRGRDIFIDFLNDFEGGIIFELAEEIGIENPVEECRRRITSGDSIWLHDKATAVEDLKKLLVDYNIIIESQKFGIDGKSLNACVQNWQERCRFNLKIPADILGEYYPTLKNFLALLKKLVERGEIAQSNREDFLRELVDNAATVRKTFSEALKILRDKYSYQLDGLNDEEIKELYDTLPKTSFTDSQGHYHKNVDDSARKVKSKQLKSRLLNLWREVAGNKNPREWSKEHRTPMIVMVPDAEQATAQKVFDIVMSASPEEQDVRFAIDYLKKCPPYFAGLNDRQRIEKAFSEKIVGDRRCILDDNNEVRNELERKFVGDAYQWYSNSQANKIVNELAKNKYYSGGAYDKVNARINRMTDREAKDLLLKLVDKNYEVGLKLLRES